MTVSASPGGSNVVRFVLCISVGFRRRMGKKKRGQHSVTFFHSAMFMSTVQPWEQWSERSKGVCLWQQTSANPIQSWLPPSHTNTHTHSHTYTHIHTQAPSKSPETKQEAWEKDGCPLAPCIQLREVTEETLCPLQQPYPTPVAWVPVHQHQSLLKMIRGQSQMQANALEGMFQFKIKLIWKKRRKIGRQD